MAKDFLAFLGLIFLVLIILVMLSVVGFTYDLLGLVDVPEYVPTTLAQILGPREATLTFYGIDTPEWRNPLEDLPRASATVLPTAAPTQTPLPPTAIPTSTPVPPMEPAEYRAEQVLNLKEYSNALQGWLDANRDLGQQHSLLDDPTWRVEMDGWLGKITESGRALGMTGPAPVEYKTIAVLLNRVSEASEALSGDYRRALDTRNSEDFQKAGDDFERIKAFLTEAVQAMIAANWTIE